MFEIKKLSEDQAEVKQALDEISRKVEAEKRPMSEDEFKSWDTLETKHNEIERQLETARRLGSFQTKKQEASNQQITSYKPKNITRRDQVNVFRAYALKASGNGSLISRTIWDSVEKTNQQNAIDSPSFEVPLPSKHFNDYGEQEIERTSDGQSVAVGAAGGFLTSGDLFVGLDVKLKYFGGMRQVAKVRPVAKGTAVHYAIRDNTARKAKIYLTENVAVVPEDIVYSSLPLTMFDWTSGVWPISLRLLQDAEYPIEQDIRDCLVECFARGQNEKFTIGTGTNEPFGVIAGASASGVVTAAPGAVTYSELLGLFYSIDKAYRDSPNFAFMLNDATVAALRGVVDGAGRPMFLGQDSNAFGNIEMTIFGKPVVINNDMPAIGANAKCVLAGDFSKYLICDARSLDIFVMRERFLDQLAIGMIGYMRSTGRVINGSAIKYLVAHA